MKLKFINVKQAIEYKISFCRCFMRPFMIILFSLWVLSCEKSIDYQIENQKSEVVMYAFPMPDSTFKVHVSYTTDILSQKEFEEISNVEISIQVNDETIITADYPDGTDWYALDNVNVSGEDSVKIQLSINDSLYVTSRTQIPEPIQIISFDTTRVLEYNEDGVEEEMLQCNLNFFDPTDIDNYFQIRVDAYTTLSDNDNLSRTAETIDIIEKDKVFISQDYEATLLADIDYQSTFSDYLINGQYYSVSFLIPNEYINNTGDKQKRIVYLYLFSLSSEYYNYVRSVAEQEAFREDPFYEQSNVYTNVTNGLGAFAGLALDVDSFTIYNNLE